MNHMGAFAFVNIGRMTFGKYCGHSATKRAFSTFWASCASGGMSAGGAGASGASYGETIK